MRRRSCRRAVGDGLVGGVGGGLDPQRRPRPRDASGVAGPWAREDVEHVAGGAGGGQAGDVGVRRRRHAVADDEHRAAAGLGGAGDRRRRPRCGGAGRRGRYTAPATAAAARLQWSRSLARLGSPHVVAVAVGGDRPAALGTARQPRAVGAARLPGVRRSTRCGRRRAELGAAVPRRTRVVRRRRCRTGGPCTPTLATRHHGVHRGPRWPGRPARSARRGPASARPARGSAASSPSRSAGSCAGTRRSARPAAAPFSSTVAQRRARARRAVSRRAVERVDASRRLHAAPARRTARAARARTPASSSARMTARLGVARGWSAAPGRAPRARRPGRRARAADPGQPERGRGRVVGVGARAGDVERLGDVRLAAALARQRQRQLGRQLAGHLAVDGVERRPARRRRRRVPARQAAQPDGAPLPRVVRRASRRRPGRPRPRRPASQRGACRSPAAPRRCPPARRLEQRDAAAPGRSTLTRGQPARRRVARVDLAARAARPSPAVGRPSTSGASNSTDGAECSAGLRRPCGRWRRPRAARRAAARAARRRRRTGPPGRARTPWPAAGRTSRSAGTAGCPRPAAATPTYVDW